MKRKQLILVMGCILSALFILQACETTNGKAKSNKKAEAVSSASPLEGKVVNGVRVIKMEVKNHVIIPRKFYVEVGEKVKILIKSTQGNHTIKFDKLKLETKLPEGVEKVLEFTAPSTKAKVNFECTVDEGNHGDAKGYMIVKPKP